MDVNAVNRWGRTALIWAAKRGSLELVELLYEKGTDINVADEKGMTALMYAQQEKHIDVVEFLENPDSVIEYSKVFEAVDKPEVLKLLN